MPYPRIRAAVAVQGPQGLLLVRHQKGARSYWLLPGGGVEFGEPARAAVRREMLEETGLEVDVQELMFAAESLAPDQSRHLLHLIFRAHVTGGSIRVEEPPADSESGRVVEVQWVPLAKLGELVMHPPFRQQLLAALERPALEPPIFLENLWVE